MGNNDTKYRDMISHVKAIIFLSTPHRGSSLAKSLVYILQIASMSKSYIKELSSHSTFLQSINDEFSNMCGGLKLYSFYETMKTSIGPRKVLVCLIEASY